MAAPDGGGAGAGGGAVRAYGHAGRGACLPPKRRATESAAEHSPTMLDMSVYNPLSMKSFHVVWTRNVQECTLKSSIGKARLVHEMAHVWQETYGEPSRRGYHNRQWAEKMREVGLQPTSTGEPGGMETGQSVTHYIIPEGHYARAYAQLASSGYKLHWQSLPAVGSAKKTSKRKFTCPECRQNAWAKPGACLICGQCVKSGEGELRYMVPEKRAKSVI